MKKLALGLLSLFLVVGSINAQEGKKALKKGSKLLAKYGTNAVSNADALDEGLMLVEKAFDSDEIKNEAKYYTMLGTAYNQVVNGQINAKVLDPAFEVTHGDYAVKAFDSFKKAYGMAEKGGDKKKAIQGMQANESHLNNLGIYSNELKDYKTAFTYWNTALDVYSELSSLGEESRMDDEVVRKDHYYYTAAMGYYAKENAGAAPILQKMIEDKTDNPFAYLALYEIKSGINNKEGEEAVSAASKAEAATLLEQGRTLFPDDTGLLFAEINYYLTEGKLDVLTGKLKSALEKEPDNITIYTTLGNVYDQLNQTERTAGNTAKADEYFDEALNYYAQALEKDPENFDAVYSQGALYYNKAASLTGAINELANDFSAAGTKKYDALKATMDGYFGEAMPFFLKAEGMNGNDLNTLIALKEIHARKNEMDKVAEYKTKIETLQAGGE